MSSYLQEFASEFPVDYISSPEVVFLKSLKSGLNVHNHSPKLILRIPSEQGIEPTTNVTYRSILNHLRTVTTYASGILVPKGLIWPMSNAQYLQAETALIREAHAAGLTIYVSGFANDVSDLAYNYSFDPVREYLQFVPRRGSKVDGFVTDFPTTASDALGKDFSYAKQLYVIVHVYIVCTM
jgi:glycerophosphoryl diester phosphodiesterase